MASAYCSLCGLRHLGKCGPKVEPFAPGLSCRENQVLSMVCLGYSNEQIATELGVSVQTVKNHIFATFDKCGVNSRFQLAFKFLAPSLTAKIAKLEDLLQQSVKREQKSAARMAAMKATIARERAITNRFLGTTASKGK